MNKSIEKENKATVAPVKTVKGLLNNQSFKKQMARLLPVHLTPDRMAQLALTATSKTPLLLECTPESVFKSMLDLSQMGLEPDGRHAHLIPRKNNRAGIVECTVIPDFKGLVLLAMNTGMVKRIHSEIVRDNDDFEWAMGKVKHSIDMKKDRGEIIAAWNVIEYVNGGEKYEVMTVKQMNEVRDRQYKTTSGPWITDTEEMYKKTVYRRNQKWAPLKGQNPSQQINVSRFEKAIEVDNSQFDFETPQLEEKTDK